MRLLTHAAPLGGIMLAAMVSAASAQTTIRYAHMNSPTHFVHTEAEVMARKVAERTNNEVRIELFPSGQLGESTQIAEQISFGADMIGQIQAGNLASYVPDFSVIVYPFMYGDSSDIQKLLDSDLVAEMNALAEQKNLKVLCFLHYGIRDLYTRNREVHSPEDTQNLNIRVQPVTIYTQMVEKVMRASPTPIPWPEVYSALAQGVIDAAEAPPLSILDQRHQEHARYLIQTNHIQDVVPLVMSASTFNALSEEHQAVLQEEAGQACERMSQASIASYEAGIEELRKQGMTIISDVDREAFAALAGGISEAFPEWTPGLYERARAIVQGE